MESPYSLPESEKLHIEYFGRLFDNTSECYKMFWFQSIFRKILEGKTSATFEEIIDDMIADAWYMVTEYHLNLGPRDTLELAVNRLSEKNPSIKPSENKETIIELVKNTEDSEIRKYKSQLTYNVPYRLQAPFLDFKSDDWKAGTKDLATRINRYHNLLYRFGTSEGLMTEIMFDEAWCEYIKTNQTVIRGWLDFNLVAYLQRRNPNVPGVIDKLEPPQERKLTDIIDYWRFIINVEESEGFQLHEIYHDSVLTAKDISIDHFVPWSYVANDEIWNLHPTTKSINSKKSNYLPNWDKYFESLSHIEYLSYSLMWKNEAVHKKFDKCIDKHLNSPTVKGRLYSQGLSETDFKGRLSEILLPVYQSAKSAGFREWEYS